MQTKLLIVTLILFAIFVSCNTTVNKENNNTILDSNKVLADTQLVITPDTLQKEIIVLPESFLFKYTECIQNCTQEKIVSKKYKGDTLVLRIGSIQNCIGKFKLAVKTTDTKLKLDISVQEEIRKGKNGKTDTVLTTLDCDCYYYFDIGIKNITHKFKTILVNGHKLD